MSRGPGIWQRLILSALEISPYFYLYDLLPDSATPSQRSALRRALRELYDARKVEWYGFMTGANSSHAQKTVVSKHYHFPGHSNRKAIEAVDVAMLQKHAIEYMAKCCASSTAEPVQHLNKGAQTSNHLLMQAFQ